MGTRLVPALIACLMCGSVIGGSQPRAPGGAGFIRLTPDEIR